MSKSVLDWIKGGKHFSYKRVTISICFVNLVAALYLLHSLYICSSHPGDIWQTIEQANRVEESAVVRITLGPEELVGLTEKLRERSKGKGWLEISQSVKGKLADEILQRLRELGDGANMTEQGG